MTAIFVTRLIISFYYETTKDGVEEIADFAFSAINTYLELVIPRSVRRIGDALFGAEGFITIRN